MSKVIVIDGNSIASRAFYALPLLSNSSGLHTNAVYGFTTMLLKLIEEQKPTHFLVAFDAGKVVFRHQEYGEYKGGRLKTPPELSEQFPLIKELLESFGIRRFELAGYEADDIIGTLTKAADAAEDMEVLVVTGDKDMLQLSSDKVTIALTRKGISEMELYDPAAIQEKYGLSPQQIIDLKGLMGDTSDNIPGIPGVGEKTALKMLHQYGSVEAVLEHADELTGKMKEKVKEHAQDARMSKELATIFREVPMDLEWTGMAYQGYDPASLAGMFRKLEFKSLLEKLDLTGASLAADEAEAGAGGNAELAVRVLKPADVADFAADGLDRIEAVHVELYGENPHLSTVVGVAFYADGEAVVLPFDVLNADEAEPVRLWLADADKPKRIYDQHRAELALHWRGMLLKGCAFDVHLAGYLLDPTDTTLSLHALALKYKAPSVEDDEAVFGKGAKYQVPEEAVLGAHLGRKVRAVAELSVRMQAELERLGMDKLYHELELPLSGVLADMEKTGIKTNAEVLHQLGAEFGAQLEGLMAKIYEHGGGEFNINSPKQLGEVLFERLGLSTAGVKKNKTGYSTDADVLEKLSSKHEIVRYILDYRTLAKLQSTYVEGLLKEIRPETGKIHTYFRQTIAATGRLSSQYPNLQNIPIRLEEGRKIRKAFVPSEPGWRIVAADYSQIELRVLAHISGDEKLIEAFQLDMDIHTKTAMDVFGVSADQVDANMRRQAKAVNFGIVYGISSYGLSQNLDIGRLEADRFIEQYFAVFQGVRAYMDDIVKHAKRDGYVTTLLARRRYLPEINASNFNLRSFAERTAMNTPIQGTAADIIKLAMVRMAERLKEEKLASRMLLQVHDELVFEVPEEEFEIMQKLVPEVMSKALELKVPLKAEVSTGTNWYESK
ncbi:DNA polymerase I [Gorillibacterium sp. sgz5001074]|uniref:DNA polymerase I n=1 Tax=Gorillibacterium sp. sgz5001074 TaxID=3446695 RepID=UPI003F681A65